MAIFFHEFFVGADLRDAAALQHDDQVTLTERAQAVGDDEGSAAEHGSLHGVEDFMLGVRVDGCGGSKVSECLTFLPVDAVHAAAREILAKAA